MWKLAGTLQVCTDCDDWHVCPLGQYRTVGTIVVVALSITGPPKYLQQQHAHFTNHEVTVWVGLLDSDPQHTVNS